MYQALYRKWRPRTFDEVAGQAHITDTLKSEVVSGRLSHAYLFTGSRGTGKTSCAKILSRAVNCESPVEGNPCNDCPSCRGIENGSILDVVEMDAASNNGVDHVRALREEAAYTPAAALRRVYIIDEVHMLTTPAFNALLKIMEEPPEHLIFILATTEAHKIPATILSRCQRFAFKRVSPEDIAVRLAYVAERENISLSTDAGILLARLADGSVRDALSLLDQCAVAGSRVDAGLVVDLLGLAGGKRTAELLNMILRRDTAAALLLFSELYSGGKDVSAILDELSCLIRDLMILKAAPEGGIGLISGIGDPAEYKTLAEGFSLSRLVFCLDAISGAQAKLPHSTGRRVDAELCLVTLCDESLSLQPSALTARIERLESGFTPSGKAEAGGHLPFDTPGASQEDRPEAAEKKIPAEAGEEGGEEKKTASEKAKKLPQNAAFWPDVIAKLKGRLSPPELACLSNRELVDVTVRDGELIISYSDDVTGRTINKQHIKDALTSAMADSMPLRIIRAHAREEGDKFLELISTAKDLDNIEIL